MIREDQYAGLCTEVKSLQKQVAEADRIAGNRWKQYDAERQNHEITKRELANERSLTDMLAGAIMGEGSIDDALKRYRDRLANGYDKARVSAYLSNTSVSGPHLLTGSETNQTANG